MLPSIATAPTEQRNLPIAADNSSPSARYGKPAFYLALLILLSITEFLLFSKTARSAGFYLDDWSTLAALRFGPVGLLAMCRDYCLHMPLMLIRPIQALHYPLLYHLGGLQPLTYHVSNACLDVLSAFLLGCCAVALGCGRRVALIASIFFLLLPTHDSTHYWAIASSGTLSLCLYLASLLSMLHFAHTRRVLYYILSLMAFTLSLFNYEICLPLFLFTAVSAAFVSCNTGAGAKLSSDANPASDGRSRLHTLPSLKYVPLRTALVTVSGGIACVALYVFYRNFIAPRLGAVWLHAPHFDASVMLATLSEGFAINSPTGGFVWLFHRLCSWHAGLNADRFVAVAIVCALLTGCFLFQRERAIPSKTLVILILAGIFEIGISYTIFGLNSEYIPTLASMVDRVNHPASIGAAIAYAATCMLAGNLVGASLKQVKATSFLAPLVSLSLALLLGTFFMSCDFVMSQCWLKSAMMQRHVADCVAAHKGELSRCKSVLLVNCPRYVYSAPVFDGVWDFEKMLQVKSENHHIAGDVVSDRMVITRDGVSDISKGFDCGDFKFGSMVALVATSSELIPINSGADFVNVVEHKGMGFGIPASTLENWRAAIVSSSKSIK